MKNKKINSAIFILFFMFLSACGTHRELDRKSLNVEKMSAEKRTTYLTNTAKEIYKKYPEFYREDAKVTIEKKKTIPQETIEENDDYLNPKSVWYGMRPEQTYYSVTFEAGEYSETSTRWYPVTVYIREDTGKAIIIQIDNMGYYVKE